MDTTAECKYLRPIKNRAEYKNLLVNLSKNDKTNKTVYICNFILNLYRWSGRLEPNEFPFNQLKVLVPADQNNTTVVVVVDRTDKFWPHCIWGYASQNDNGLLIDCLKNSIYIDWRQSTLLAAVHEFNLDSIIDLVNTKQCKIIEQDVCDMYTIDKHIALDYKIT